jgi:hypothetical protein
VAITAKFEIDAASSGAMVNSTRSIPTTSAQPVFGDEMHAASKRSLAADNIGNSRPYIPHREKSDSQRTKVAIPDNEIPISAPAECRAHSFAEKIGSWGNSSVLGAKASSQDTATASSLSNDCDDRQANSSVADGVMSNQANSQPGQLIGCVSNTLKRQVFGGLGVSFPAAETLEASNNTVASAVEAEQTSANKVPYSLDASDPNKTQRYPVSDQVENISWNANRFPNILPRIGKGVPSSAAVDSTESAKADRSPTVTRDPKRQAPGADPAYNGNSVQIPGAAESESIGESLAASADVVGIDTNSTGKSGLSITTNGKDASKIAVGDVAGLKPNPQVSSPETSSAMPSGESAPSVNQSQGGTTQAQGVLSEAMVTIHADSPSAQAGIAQTSVSAFVSPMPSGSGGHLTSKSDCAPTSGKMPESVPAISTAKLIQTMGQTEMRVGLHSNEFGNISISTSATRDLVSTQISLDHGELAKVLATHLPEIQARIGGAQTIDVRLDSKLEAEGQGTSTSNGASGSPAEQSPGNRSQGDKSVPSYHGSIVSGQVVPAFSKSTISRDGGVQPLRLDIRI